MVITLLNPYYQYDNTGLTENSDHDLRYFFRTLIGQGRSILATFQGEKPVFPLCSIFKVGLSQGFAASTFRKNLLRLEVGLDLSIGSNT